MSVLPAPVALDPPPGDPEALAVLAGRCSGAAVQMGELAARLTGAAGRVPGWRGADAEAAAARSAAVAAVAARAPSGLRDAALALLGHADLLRTARGRIAVLRAEQADDFAVARARLTGPGDPLSGTGDLVELEARERARAQAHRAVLDEVADDVAATGRALGAATAGLGGARYAPFGDTTALLARLSTELPGWGTSRLADEGRVVGEALRTGTSFEQIEARARAALRFATTPAFADAFLVGLGTDGVGDLLDLVDHTDLGAGSALAALLAAVFGAPRPADGTRPAAGRVLAARYLDPGDASGLVDQRARGMAAVLGATRAPDGVGPATLLSWGRQMLAREAALGPMPDRLTTLSDDERHADPLVALAEAVARQGNPEVAAGLLDTSEAWAGSLSRPWADGGDALADVVALLEHAGADSGGAAVRSALEALGSGLGETGDPEAWTVDRDVADLSAPALGRAVAAHLPVTVELLTAAGADAASAADRTALRGLGYLTIDERAAAAVQRGIDGWRRALPQPGELHAAGLPLPGVTVPGAYLAVREYGQRLAHALHGYEQRRQARIRSGPWVLADFALDVAVRGGGGPVLGGVTAVAARGLGIDGRWENGPDTGDRFDRSDAVLAAIGDVVGGPVAGPVAGAAAGLEAGAGRTVLAGVVGREAGAAFDHGHGLLGTPLPPVAPDDTWPETFVDGTGALDLVDGLDPSGIADLGPGPEPEDGVVGTPGD